MDERKKGLITYLVVVGGSALFILSTLGGEIGANDVIVETVGKLGPTGEVVSVEGPPGEKQALVRLESGDVVRAEVPERCLVFPGQLASLSEVRGALVSGPKYRIFSAKDK